MAEHGFERNEPGGIVTFEDFLCRQYEQEQAPDWKKKEILLQLRAAVAEQQEPPGDQYRERPALSEQPV